MSYLELTDLAEDEILLKREVHRFAEEVIRPASIEIDRMPSDKYQKEITKRDSPYWKVMREMKKLGYHRAIVPEEFGGDGLSAREVHILVEEIAWGSSGFAMALGVDFVPIIFGILSLDDYIKENLVQPWLEDKEAKFQGCWGATEPEHGSDLLMVSSMSPEDRQRVSAGQVTAIKDENEWVINGPKSYWISAAPVATHVGLHVNMDFAKGVLGGTCIVPLDLPGVMKGEPILKLGQRECPQGELVFENVRIPERYVIPAFEFATEAETSRIMGQFLSTTSCWMAACSTGLARAAFEEALKYSRERMQGGKPICEHQLIKKKLFDMFTKVETARAYSRRVMEHVWEKSLVKFTWDASLRHALAAQVYCKQVAYEVADEAIQIHGGCGTTEDYLVQKLYRDARVKLIEDGTTEVLSLEGARDIVRNY